jgi:hypothetical protein
VGDASNLIVNTNGDQLAKFYHCSECREMFAVGCLIGGQFRGAVNSLLLDQRDHLGASMQIQPRLLTATEKPNRWGKLWVSLEGVS